MEKYIQKWLNKNFEAYYIQFLQEQTRIILKEIQNR